MKNQIPVTLKRQTGSVRNTVIVVVVVVFVMIFVGMQGRDEYATKTQVLKTLSSAGPLRQSISEFHKEQQRFPTSREAEKFRVDAGDAAQAIVYDAEKRMIVVTMGDPLKDKRYAIHAEEKDKMISWTCRTIDLDPKFLSPACR